MNSDAQVFHVETAVHGRVLVRPSASPSPEGVLVGFHGYAETADVQLSRFSGISGTDCWILASVEALNRFYRGRSEHTVASWMTRQDRDRAIAANIAYVDRAIDQVRNTFQRSGENWNKGDSPLKAPVPLILAGFSQGAAMAFRAAVLGSNKVEGVIAVGGDVPPELLTDAGTRFPTVLLIRGARDDWYTQERFDMDVAALNARGATVSALVADAGHEWTTEISAAVARFLTSVRPERRTSRTREP